MSFSPPIPGSFPIGHFACREDQRLPATFSKEYDKEMPPGFRLSERIEHVFTFSCAFDSAPKLGSAEKQVFDVFG